MLVGIADILKEISQDWSSNLYSGPIPLIQHLEHYFTQFNFYYMCVKLLSTTFWLVSLTNRLEIRRIRYGWQLISIPIRNVNMCKHIFIQYIYSVGVGMGPLHKLFGTICL